VIEILETFGWLSGDIIDVATSPRRGIEAYLLLWVRLMRPGYPNFNVQIVRPA